MNRDEVVVRRVTITPEKMQMAYRRAAENAKHRVQWITKKRSDQKLERDAT